MVVLDGGAMLSSNGNQYLQPDYLSPLPTTLDAKKSPLALLAQTCSQIGADSPPTKPLIASKKGAGATDASRTSPKEKEREKEKEKRHSPPEPRLAFKPYEANVISEEVKQQPPAETPPQRKSTSPASRAETPSGSSSERKSATPRAASPIIRSGLEVLQAKDVYRPLCCPPGMEHAANPAFRPPAFAHQHHQHAAMLAAAAASGYPPAAASPAPYLSYARVKTAAGGEALVPVCKDPYCTGCQFSVHSQQMLMAAAAAACPSGCTQCDHQKYNLAMAMSLGQVVAPPPPPATLAYAQMGRPYVCNWIAGDAYCGKRFVTSEELLQHLRTHTSGSEPAAALLNAHPLFAAAARYPNPPLSPLAAAARYHPYGKPPLAASPYSAFNPTTTAALGPYYSPYSTLYGQRLGAAVQP